jgi:hypothetical protein
VRAIEVKSKIYLSEQVENKDRVFGEALHYFPAIVKSETGVEHPALFTWYDIEQAIERAAKNLEDFPKTKSLWEVIFG